MSLHFKKSIDAYTFKPIVYLYDGDNCLSNVPNETYQRWCCLMPVDREKEVDEFVKSLNQNTK